MGASLVYLEKPNKEIELQEGENDYIQFSAASMQGWRLNMVLIIFPNFLFTNISYFEITYSDRRIPTSRSSNT